MLGLPKTSPLMAAVTLSPTSDQQSLDAEVSSRIAKATFVMAK